MTLRSESPRPAARTNPVDTSPGAVGPRAVREPSPFFKLGLDAHLVMEAVRRGFETPFEIQRDGIPPAIAGENLMLLARTGEGKTLAYGLATIHRLFQIARPGETAAVIVVTTEQLGRQVEDELRPFVGRTALSIEQVREPLEDERGRYGPSSASLLVGTVGNLAAAAEAGAIDLSRVRIVVLDEVDQLLDMRSSGALDKLLELHLPPASARQTMLVTATIPKVYVGEFVQLLPGGRIINASIERPIDRIKHVAYECESWQRTALLKHLVRKENPEGAVAFCLDPSLCEAVARELRDAGIPAMAIHAELEADTRIERVQQFRDKAFTVLVATGDMARGLDVKHVSIVFNVDLPETVDEYLQQVGRTGRAGREGTAVTFVPPFLKWDLDTMLTTLSLKAEQRKLPPEIGVVRRKGESGTSPSNVVAAITKSTGHTFQRPALLLSAVDQNRRFCDPRETCRLLNLLGREILPLVLTDLLVTNLSGGQSVEELRRTVGDRIHPSAVEAASHRLGLTRLVRREQERERRPGYRASNAEQAFFNLLGALFVDSGSLEKPREVVAGAFEIPHVSSASRAARAATLPIPYAAVGADRRLELEAALGHRFEQAVWLDVLAEACADPASVRSALPPAFAVAGRDVLDLFLVDRLRRAADDSRITRVRSRGLDNGVPENVGVKLREERSRRATLEGIWDQPAASRFDIAFGSAFGWGLSEHPDAARSAMIGFLGAMYLSSGFQSCATLLDPLFPDLGERIAETDSRLNAVLDPRELQQAMTVEGEYIERRAALRAAEAERVAAAKLAPVVRPEPAKTMPAPTTDFGAALRLHVQLECPGQQLKVKAAKGGELGFVITVTLGKRVIATVDSDNQPGGIQQACRDALTALGAGPAN